MRFRFRLGSCYSKVLIRLGFGLIGDEQFPDQLTSFLLPPSVDDWLPERHLARFVVEVVESLNLRSMTGGYRGSGSASYHPSMLLALLIYGYATGVFSSRKLEGSVANPAARFRSVTVAAGADGFATEPEKAHHDEARRSRF